ncbi:MAG: zinc-dependent metalloprotease family protein [Planctomycetota bacterium]
MTAIKLLPLLGLGFTSLALCAPPQVAPQGRFRLPSGSSALVYPGSEGPALHVLTPRGEAQGAWLRAGSSWLGSLGDSHLEARPDRGGLLVRVRPTRGPARSERWKPISVRIPVSVAVLQGEGPAALSPDDVREAQRAIREQLVQVYAPVGLEFELAPPVPVARARADANGDGRLDKDEVRALRDHLERIGLKQPGRVVLALTATPIVGTGCRGWTLGDGVATPHTLTDHNDNFSIVSLRYLTGHHTVAHEVGHQFGLDDLGRENRRRLAEPARGDHLMDSGGEGFYLDPEALRHMHRVTSHQDLGLAGRRTVAPLPAAAPAQPVQGLGGAPVVAPR